MGHLRGAVHAGPGVLAMSIAAYRNAIILAAVAVGSAGAAWTVQGWRRDKAIAELTAAHTAAEAARADAKSRAWGQAAQALTEQVKAANAKLAIQRTANAAMLRRLQAEQAAMSGDYACRAKPLPESYLEVYRAPAQAE